MKISNVTTRFSDYEQVASCKNDEADYQGFIAIHNTILGPALGGTRFWRYESDAAAIEDVLRLARGMTYKNALAGIPFGGGKAIVLARNGATNREGLFRAHGKFVETFGGKYVTAEDVGMGTSDMEYVRMETRHVAGLKGQSGDPSPGTAKGVFRAIAAAAKKRWGSEELTGRRVAIQGCGHVGYYLACYLRRAGAALIVADLCPEKVQRIVYEFQATAVSPDWIHSAQADIFAPCALGGSINDLTVPQLKTEIVVGAANNQLLEERHGDALWERGILYVPDYAANAGGVINLCRELLGWEASYAALKVDDIYSTVTNIFRIADAEGISTHRAADRLAEEQLGART